MEEEYDSIVVGIDPGWESFGISLTINGEIKFTMNYIPSRSGDPHTFLSKELFPDLSKVVTLANITDLYIERFVAYAGIHSNASEDILMMIGATCYAFKFLTYECKVHMVRAIDWKQQLCKYLVRTKDFNNPYPSFDKKYSILAAQTISGSKAINTNHEADAICLSYMKEVEQYEVNRRAILSKRG